MAMTAKDMIAAMDTTLAIIDSLMLYWHNTDPAEIIDEVYVSPIGAYRDEKIATYKDGLVRFWGQIDWPHRERMLGAAISKYGSESTRKLMVHRQES